MPQLTKVIVTVVALGAFLPAGSAVAGSPLEPEECDLSPLPVKAECFRLAVPENRSVTSSRAISLFGIILRSPAVRPTKEPLVFLQGGPGEAANVEAETLARSAFLARQDVVLIDQRGTGRSSPALQCPEYAAVAPRFFAPGVGYAEARSFARRALARCAARLRAAGVDLAGYRSKEAARDLEDLRAALGAPRLDLYGVSYGTRAALATLREYPRSIRAVVVDSGSGPDGADTRPSILAANLRDGFKRYFRRRKDLRRQFRRTMRSYDRAPLRAFARTGGAGKPQRVEITGPDVAVLIHQLLRDRVTARAVPEVIAGLRARDRAVVEATMVPLLEAATTPGDSILGAQLSVDCGDAAPLKAPDRRLVEHPGALATFLLFASGGFCDTWGVPTSPAADRRPVAADSPVLLVAGSRDPISPPRALRASARRLTRGSVVELRGEGHVPTLGRPCLERALAHWLARPAVRSAPPPDAQRRPRRNSFRTNGWVSFCD